MIGAQTQLNCFQQQEEEGPQKWSKWKGNASSGSPSRSMFSLLSCSHPFFCCTVLYLFRSLAAYTLLEGHWPFSLLLLLLFSWQGLLLSVPVHTIHPPSAFFFDFIEQLKMRKQIIFIDSRSPSILPEPGSVTIFIVSYRLNTTQCHSQSLVQCYRLQSTLSTVSSE